MQQKDRTLSSGLLHPVLPMMQNSTDNHASNLKPSRPSMANQEHELANSMPERFKHFERWLLDQAFIT